MTTHVFKDALIYRRDHGGKLSSTTYWRRLLTLMGRKKTKRVECVIRTVPAKMTKHDLDTIGGLRGYTASGFIEF